MKLVLTDEERAQLLRWSRRRRSSQALALRSRIVLACADGTDNKVDAPQCQACGTCCSRRKQRPLTQAGAVGAMLWWPNGGHGRPWSQTYLAERCQVAAPRYLAVQRGPRASKDRRDESRLSARGRVQACVTARLRRVADDGAAFCRLASRNVTTRQERLARFTPTAPLLAAEPRRPQWNEVCAGARSD